MHTETTVDWGFLSTKTCLGAGMSLIFLFFAVCSLSNKQNSSIIETLLRRSEASK